MIPRREVGTDVHGFRAARSASWVRSRVPSGAQDRHRWALVGLVGVSLGLAGCGQGKAAYGEVSQGAPVRVETVDGTGLKRVTLTGESATKLGLRTAAVEATPAMAVPATGDEGAPPMVVVPADAVIYDKGGRTWVYVSDGPLRYLRQAVGVAEVDGPNAVLRSGPVPGAQVVVVGADELLGAELGVAGE